METPAETARTFAENDALYYTKYQEIVESMMDNEVDGDEMTRRLAIEMKKDMAAPEVVAEQAGKLKAPYNGILKAAIAYINWKQVARDFMTK